MSYRPLPTELTISKSKIHGLGVFAKRDIPPGTNLGPIHVRTPCKHFEQGLVRTPLGGFLNHSQDPNVIKLQTMEDCDTWSAVTQRLIEEGEELTLRYDLYPMEQNASEIETPVAEPTLRLVKGGALQGPHPRHYHTPPPGRTLAE